MFGMDGESPGHQMQAVLMIRWDVFGTPWTSGGLFLGRHPAEAKKKESLQHKGSLNICKTSSLDSQDLVLLKRTREQQVIWYEALCKRDTGLFRRDLT